MKKIKILLLFFLVFSCYQKSNKILINDFSKNFKDILVPKKNGSYSNISYKIKATTNDSIKIIFHGIEKIYSGKFEYNFSSDYYGDLPVEFIFEPYKATNGEIAVEYGIY